MIFLRQNSFFSLLLLVVLFCTSCKKEPLTLRVIETTDIHGELGENTSAIVGYIRQAREQYNENLLVLDCGDILQGTSEVFFSNYIDTSFSPIFADLFNYIGYDVVTVGNHDLEAGEKIYSRFYNSINAKVLCANVVKRNNIRKPMFTPYTVLKRNGYKIVVLGLVATEALEWLPNAIRKNASFIPIDSAANYWVNRIKRRENPDVLIGLFHAGNSPTEGRNSVAEIARNIPGIDLICAGHIHKADVETVVDPLGDSVVIVQAGSNAKYFAEAKIDITPNSRRKSNVHVDAKVVSTQGLPPFEPLDTLLQPFIYRARTFYDIPISYIDTTMYSEDATKGPCAWTNFLHSAYINIAQQMGFTGSRQIKISIASASLRNAVLHKGLVSVRDFILLYPYENTMSIVEMDGQEIIDYLEYSYSLLAENPDLPIYDFDTAGGLRYTVDMSKPYGERVTMIGFLDGERLLGNRPYRVVMNSYRAYGGGGHLGKGLNWSDKTIKNRLVISSEKSLRAMLIDYYSLRPLDTNLPNTWSFN